MESNVERRRPLLISISIVVAAAIRPALWLLERFMGNCGDGLCGFWPALLIIAGCTLTALALAVAGCVRGERHRWLVLAMLAALVLPVGPLIGLW